MSTALLLSQIWSSSFERLDAIRWLLSVLPLRVPDVTATFEITGYDGKHYLDGIYAVLLATLHGEFVTVTKTNDLFYVTRK